LDTFVNELAAKNEKKLIHELPDYLKSFRFEKVKLGTTPARVTAVKCYDELHADEIVIDADICYSGNCEIEVVIRGMKAGIKNIRLTGVIRIELKPLMREEPIIGGANVFFMSRPSLSFELTDAVQFITDLPMINQLLADAILDQVADFVVIPNKISMPFDSHIERRTLRFFRPLGVLRLELFGGRKLRRDFSLLGMAKNDSYANVVVQGQSYRTKTVKNRVNPKWDFAIEVPIYFVRGQQVIIEVMDKDTMGKDDYLGRVALPLAHIESEGQMEAWVDLKDTETGAVHFKAAWLALCEEAACLVKHFEMVDFFTKRYPRDSRPPDQPIASVAVVCLYLESVNGLAAIDGGQLATYHIRLSIGETVKDSRKFAVDYNHRLEENFHFLLDGLDRIIKFELFATEQRKPLGTGQVSTCELLEAPEMRSDNDIVLTEVHGTQATLKMSVVMRLLREPGDLENEFEMSGSSVEGEKMIEEIKQSYREHADRHVAFTERTEPIVEDKSGELDDGPPKKTVTASAADSHEALYTPTTGTGTGKDEKKP
jgi:Ca2+-dependent lipid-binding protein